MFAQRLLVGFAAVVCGMLIGIAGCQKKTSSGGDTPSQDPPKTEAGFRSRNNLLQIGVALHNYHDAMGYLPAAGGAIDAKKDINPYERMQRMSWRVQILPYIEQENVYRLIEMNTMQLKAMPESIATTIIPTYSNPKTNPLPLTHYRVFVGKGCAFEPNQARGVRFTDFIDGTSNTILVVETADAVNWASTDDIAYDPKAPLPKLGIFDGGFHALMADGSIRWIPSNTPEETIRAMITRNGMEELKLPGKVAGGSVDTDSGPMIEFARPQPAPSPEIKITPIKPERPPEPQGFPGEKPPAP